MGTRQRMTSLPTLRGSGSPPLGLLMAYVPPKPVQTTLSILQMQKPKVHHTEKARADLDSCPLPWERDVSWASLAAAQENPRSPLHARWPPQA